MKFTLILILALLCLAANAYAQGGGACTTAADCLNSASPRDYAGSWVTSGASCTANACAGCGANTGAFCQCRAASGAACGFVNNNACTLQWNPATPSALPQVNAAATCFDCVPTNCSNHGTCIANTGTCQCFTPGWGGSGCQTCQCQNGGTCNANDGNCNCATPAWGGNLCQTCQCLNGGSCTSGSGACACVGHWTGPLCAACTCLNGGTCNANGTCNCVNGWYGADCQNPPLVSPGGGACAVNNDCLNYGVGARSDNGGIIDGGMCKAGKCDCVYSFATSTATGNTGANCQCRVEASCPSDKPYRRFDVTNGARLDCVASC